MITYEFANRKPGWLRHDIAIHVDRDARRLFDVSVEYHRPDIAHDSYDLADLACLINGDGFCPERHRAWAIATMARIEREFEEPSNA